MTDQAMSPLRRRMIEDMTVRIAIIVYLVQAAAGFASGFTLSWLRGDLSENR